MSDMTTDMTTEPAAAQRATKDDWLNGPGDLREEDFAVPGMNKTVRLRGLSVGQVSMMAQICNKSTKKGESRVDVVRFNVLRFKFGVVDPSFSEQEAAQIMEKWGPAFLRVTERIEALTNEDPEAAEEYKAQFPAGL